jgi:hypothetical protein
MVKRVDGDKLWSESPSGEMIYGKEIEKSVKEKYSKENLNESSSKDKHRNNKRKNKKSK